MYKFRPRGCCRPCIDDVSLATHLFGYPPWRTVLQFSITPSCNSWGVWWDSEADDKVLLMGHDSLTGTDRIYEHMLYCLIHPCVNGSRHPCLSEGKPF